jgi:hypothetical protein
MAKNDPTIQIPGELKDGLNAIKVDDRETYASVIQRLLSGRETIESDEETIHLSLPRRVYLQMMMILPESLTDKVRKGVR